MATTMEWREKTRKGRQVCHTRVVAIVGDGGASVKKRGASGDPALDNILKTLIGPHAMRTPGAVPQPAE